MMASSSNSERRASDSSSSISQRPLQIIHLLGIFLRIWSIYSLYHYLSSSKVSAVLFLYCSLVPASIIFLALQKPWRGKSMSNSQVMPSIINGGIVAFYYILWAKGLQTCGPLIAVLAEYSGASLGVLSAVMYGWRSQLWRKVAGLLAMLASFYFLSQGWATRTYSPFYTIGPTPLVQTTETFGVREMIFPLAAGILSALRRVIARRLSLKNQLKRRLHAITMVSAACFLFPFAVWDSISGSYDSITSAAFPTWAYLSTVIFGIVLIFYVDNLAEERLHLVFSSPRHLIGAGGCVILMEVTYKMDFSLVGFLICSIVLALGIFEATSLERIRKSPLAIDLSEMALHYQQQGSPLPT
ncbi:zinc transporter isoform X1 [Wolffia australiana]